MVVHVIERLEGWFVRRGWSGVSHGPYAHDEAMRRADLLGRADTRGGGAAVVVIPRMGLPVDASPWRRVPTPPR